MDKLINLNPSTLKVDLNPGCIDFLLNEDQRRALAYGLNNNNANNRYGDSDPDFHQCLEPKEENISLLAGFNYTDIVNQHILNLPWKRSQSYQVHSLVFSMWCDVICSV